MTHPIRWSSASFSWSIFRTCLHKNKSDHIKNTTYAHKLYTSLVRISLKESGRGPGYLTLRLSYSEARSSLKPLWNCNQIWAKTYVEFRMRRCQVLHVRQSHLPIASDTRYEYVSNAMRPRWTDHDDRTCVSAVYFLHHLSVVDLQVERLRGHHLADCLLQFTLGAARRAHKQTMTQEAHQTVCPCECQIYCKQSTENNSIILLFQGID